MIFRDTEYFNYVQLFLRTEVMTPVMRMRLLDHWNQWKIRSQRRSEKCSYILVENDTASFREHRFHTQRDQSNIQLFIQRDNENEVQSTPCNTKEWGMSTAWTAMTLKIGKLLTFLCVYT